MFDNKDKYISENDLINKDVEEMTDEEWAEYCRVANEKLKSQYINQEKKKLMKRLKYHYFISYVYTENGSYGFGNVTVDRVCKINNDKELKNIRDYILKENKFDNLIIINFKRFK